MLMRLSFGETEMTMVDNDNYSIVTTLTQNQTYTLTGVSDFADWDIDRDFFERADASNPEALTFLPMSGMYKVTANFKHSYLRNEAIDLAGMVYLNERSAFSYTATVCSPALLLSATKAFDPSGFRKAR